MTTAALFAVTDAAKNPLSAKQLGSDLETLAALSLTVQANALVLQRQVRVDPFAGDPLLSTNLQTLQDRMRRSATYFLNRLLPDMIGGVADATAAASLVLSLKTTLGEPLATADNDSAARRAAAGLLEAVTDELDRYSDGSSTLALALEREASSVEGASSELTAAVEERIRQLDGPDGAIAKTQAGVTTTQDAIEADLQAVVTGAKDIGSAVKSLVTGILTTFGLGSSPDKPDPAKPTDDKPADDADDTTTAVRAGGEQEVAPFPVESIGAVSDGVSGYTAAMHKFGTDNATLARLYQQLYQQRATLAVAAAVRVQVDCYARALRAMAAAAADVEKSWAEIRSGFATFQQDVLGAADPASEISLLTTTLAVAINTSWSRLPGRIGPIRSALVGYAGAIPSVGPLAA